LKYGIDSLDTDACSTLWHGKYIYHSDSEIIHEFTQHQTHNFHWNTCSAVSQHLQKGEGGNVDGFGIIDEVGIVL